MFKDMKIGMKIGFGFIVILLLAAVVVYSGHTGLIALEDRVDKADDVNRLVKYILDVRRSEKNYILRDDRRYADDVLAKLDEMRKQVRETKTKFKQDVNKIQMDDVLAEIGDYDRAFNEYLDIEVKQKEQEAHMVRDARELEKIVIELRQGQKEEYSRFRARNASEAELNDKLTKSDDANRIIKWELECRRDEKNFILRGDIESFQRVIENIKNIINQAIDLKSRFNKKENQEMAEQIIVSAKDYQKAFFKYKELDDILEANLEKMVNAAKLFEDTCAEARTDQKNKMLNEMTSAKNMMLIGIIAAIVFGIIISFVIIRAITIPITRITEIAKEISNGNLAHEVEIVQKDEIGQLADAFRKMKESMREQAGALMDAVNVISSLTSEIATTVTQLASSVSETATSATETTTTMEEVKQTADLASNKSKTVSENAQKAQQISIAGKQATDETIDGMNRIKTQMGSIAESIVTLSEQNQAIGEITATVDDIAEQTNLLAVNASIEAVKAGEMGKGFSVVAREIKDLANQSRQATKRVRVILNEIQRSTGKAVLVTEEGSKAVEAGVKQAKQSGEAISTLTGSITEAAQTAIQIAASSQQQLVGIDQVGSAMMNIKEASAQNASGTKQLEIAAQNLDELGQNLKQIMGWYKFEA